MGTYSKYDKEAAKKAAEEAKKFEFTPKIIKRIVTVAAVVVAALLIFLGPGLFQAPLMDVYSLEGAINYGAMDAGDAALVREIAAVNSRFKAEVINKYESSGLTDAEYEAVLVDYHKEWLKIAAMPCGDKLTAAKAAELDLITQALYFLNAYHAMKGGPALTEGVLPAQNVDIPRVMRRLSDGLHKYKA